MKVIWLFSVVLAPELSSHSRQSVHFMNCNFSMSKIQELGLSYQVDFSLTLEDRIWRPHLPLSTALCDKVSGFDFSPAREMNITLSLSIHYRSLKNVTDSNTGHTEVKGSWIWGKSMLHSKALSWRKINKQEEKKKFKTAPEGCFMMLATCSEILDKICSQMKLARKTNSAYLWLEVMRAMKTDLQGRVVKCQGVRELVLLSPYWMPGTVSSFNAYRVL